MAISSANDSKDIGTTSLVLHGDERGNPGKYSKVALADLDAAVKALLGGSLTVEELDGSPTGAVTKIVFPNGSLVIVGSIATLTFGTTSSPAFSAAPTLPPTDVIYFGALTANVTAFNLSGTQPRVQVWFTQDATAGRTVTAGSSIEFGIDIPSLAGIASGANASTLVGLNYNPITSKYRVVAILK